MATFLKTVQLIPFCPESHVGLKCKRRETFLKPVVLDKFSYETHKNASDKIQNSTPVLHVKIQREI